jgi:hypothetical protein
MGCFTRVCDEAGGLHEELPDDGSHLLPHLLQHLHKHTQQEFNIPSKNILFQLQKGKLEILRKCIKSVLYGTAFAFTQVQNAHFNDFIYFRI